jgi:hypothetical protein
VHEVTYVPTEILRDHQERRDTYGSILVWADSFNFPNLESWYITVVPVTFESSDGALQWCRSKNIDKDNCFAKLLSHRTDIGLTIALNK